MRKALDLIWLTIKSHYITWRMFTAIRKDGWEVKNKKVGIYHRRNKQGVYQIRTDNELIREYSKRFI